MTGVDTFAPHFPTPQQGARVCRTLLALVDAQDLWTPSGPAPSASAVSGRSADPDARRALAACWVLWDGSSTLSVCELLKLPPPALEAVGELIAALARGGGAVEAWLARFEHDDGDATPALPRRAAASAR